MTPQQDRNRRADAKRKDDEARKLYKTVRWNGPNGVRARQLRAHPLCVMCEANGIVREAVVCDHVTPHRGDVSKFWDGPFQSLCVHHHSSWKQQQEAVGYVQGVDEHGRPLDPDHPWNVTRETTKPATGQR